MKQTIEIGDVARDTITGFEGVVVARTEWLHGCRRLTIQPSEMKDGKPIDACVFDEPQLELIENRHHVPMRKTGGPRPTETQRPTPARR